MSNLDEHGYKTEPCPGCGRIHCPEHQTEAWVKDCEARMAWHRDHPDKVHLILENPYPYSCDGCAANLAGGWGPVHNSLTPNHEPHCTCDWCF